LVEQLLGKQGRPVVPGKQVLELLMGVLEPLSGGSSGFRFNLSCTYLDQVTCPHGERLFLKASGEAGQDDGCYNLSAKSYTHDAGFLSG
jgi:hypothetical protein